MQMRDDLKKSQSSKLTQSSLSVNVMLGSDGCKASMRSILGPKSLLSDRIMAPHASVVADLGNVAESRRETRAPSSVVVCL